MTPTLRAMGLTALLVVALGAVSAASASAFFHSYLETTRITAEQDATEGAQKLTFAGSTITCNEARFRRHNHDQNNRNDHLQADRNDS